MRVKVNCGPAGLSLGVRRIKSKRGLGAGLSGNGCPSPARTPISPGVARGLRESRLSARSVHPRRQEVVRWVIVEHMLAQGEKIAFGPDRVCALGFTDNNSVICECRQSSRGIRER